LDINENDENHQQKLEFSTLLNWLLVGGWRHWQWRCDELGEMGPNG